MIRKLSPAEYHAMGKGATPKDLWLSKSLLWDFYQSPYAWKRKFDRGVRKEPTTDMEWGTLVDTLALTPELEESTIALSPYPDFRKAEAREWRDEQKAAGKIVVDYVTYAAAQEAAQCLWDVVSKDGEILETQSAAFAVIEGIPAKCLADVIIDGRVSDVKTTGKLDERSLRYTIRDFGYHAQMAIYIDIRRACGETHEDAATLYFQEKTFPYRVRRVELDARDIAEGRAWAASAVALWRECLQIEDGLPWPGAVLPTISGGLPISYQPE